MGWQNWNVEFTLLEYQGEWYRTNDDLRQGSNVLQYFDTVVEVNGNDFNLIKDRRNGASGFGMFNSVLIMKLFVSGQTFHDLPYFTKASGKPGVLSYRDNGDLYEASELTQIL